MLFNSLQFLVFFPVVLAVYYAIPHRLRWVWLLAASCYFYAAFIPAYLLILFCLIGIDYVAGLVIENAHGARRKGFLILSLAANCAMLGFFKYYNFFATNLTALAHATGLPVGLKTLGIVLPIGLSFHTFQSMSYTIEVYRGHQKAERHLGIYALYVLFWPQLVAGPIERPQNLLHQFRTQARLTTHVAAEGLELIIIGFAKKVLVADTLAKTVNSVYGAPLSQSGLALVIATYFFTFQIYYDFSGYSDIARGAARLMGINLMVNFNRPYISASLSEFWRRWHISLSTWFRDYVYIPLGGSRGSRLRTALNLVIVFVVSGLWHGANWTFLVWGALHGVVLATSQLTLGARRKAAVGTGAGRVAGALLTFHIVVLSWIFFRADSVSKAIYILTHLGSSAHTSWATLPDTAMHLALCVAAVAAVEGTEAWWRRRGEVTATSPALMSAGVRYAVAFGIMMLVLFRLTDDGGPQAFIYFQF